MSLRLLEYFDLLSSVLNLNIIWFLIFYLFKYFEESTGAILALQLLMLAWSLAHFAYLFSYWKSSFCKFSIIGLISGLKFSLLYEFSFLSYFSLKIVIFSWVLQFLEYILPFFLKQDLVYSYQSFADERLLDPWSRLEGPYKIGSACPSFRLLVSSLEHI